MSRSARQPSSQRWWRPNSAPRRGPYTWWLMCGIVAVVRDRGVRNPPDLAALLDALDDVDARLRGDDATPWIDVLLAAAVRLAAIEHELREGDSIAALLGDPVRRVALEHRAESCALA